MANSAFSVLGELFKLLSQFDSADFRSASRHSGLSSDMRAALVSLARESGRSAQGGASSSTLGDYSKKSLGRTSSQAQLPGDHSTVRKPNNIRHQLKAFLNDKRRFPDKGAIVQFADETGFRIFIDSKASRARAVDKLIRLVLDAPESKRAMLLNRLLVRDPQTSGWVELILRDKQ